MSKKFPPELSGETVTRSFRLPEWWDSVLEYEAKSKSTSVSSLLNQIVRRYVYFTRFTDQNPSLNISSKTLMNILNTMDDAQIIEAARKSGHLIPSQELLHRGAPFTFTSVLWLIEEIYDKHAGWFYKRYYTGKKVTRFHFVHNYGRRWSLYLKNYFEETFKEILDLNIEIELKEESVFFEIPNEIRDDL